MKLSGHVEIRIDGRVVVSEHNLITNVGVGHIAGLLNGAQTTPFKYVGLGTGTSPADVGDVELALEKTDDGCARRLGDTLEQTTTVLPNDTMRVQAIFEVTDDFDLSEMGLFSALSGGVLGGHRVFSPVSVQGGQTVVVTWTWQVTAEEELVP